MNEPHLISILTFTPLIGAIVISLSKERLANRIGLVFCAFAFLISMILGSGFDSEKGELQQLEQYKWIPMLGLNYEVGIDGLSLMMIFLTTLLVPISLITARSIQSHRRLYVALVLLLETGLIGTFTAMNFFHWFLFWELCLIPAFFMIRLWGGPRRNKVAVQFFIYTFIGSVGLLLAFVGIFATSGSFDFSFLAQQSQNGKLLELGNGDWIGLILFALAFLGVAIKVPLYPFHTWLPDTYSEAPTPVTILLTGLMSKMGMYALIRLIVPIFHTEMKFLITPLLALAVLTILLSAFSACRQKDLKRLFAYSSINHLGYCFLGIFAIMSRAEPNPVWQTESSPALIGVILQMFNHGIIAGLIFFLISRLEERCQGKKGLDDFGGLGNIIPVFSTALGFALFASLGLPGLNAFIGEFLIFKGSFGLVKWATVLSVFGLLMTAIFILNVIRKVLVGPINPLWKDIYDLTFQEKCVVFPALFIMIIAGLFPQLLINFFNATCLKMIIQLGNIPVNPF